MKKFKIFSIVVTGGISILCFSSCYYDKKELVYPVDTTGCDTLDITYTDHIQSLLTEKCYDCHSGDATEGQGIKLDSYGAAKNYGPSMVVMTESGMMPKGGPVLSSCNIARIRTWVRNGSPEN